MPMSPRSRLKIGEPPQVRHFALNRDGLTRGFPSARTILLAKGAVG